MGETRDDYKKARIFLSLMMALFEAMALSLGSVGTFWCHYVEFEDTHERYIAHAGIWTYLNHSKGGACQGYPSDLTIDAIWKTARAFSVVAAIFGSVLFVISLIVVLSALTDWPVHTGGCDVIALFFTGLCQGLTLLLLASDGFVNENATGTFFDGSKYTLYHGRKVISTGAKCTMVSSMFWILASLMSMALDQERRQKAQVLPQTSDMTAPFVRDSLK